MTAVRRPLPVLLAWAVVAALALSAWGPRDRTTWFLETVWVLVGLPLIVLTWRRFPLTDLLCCLLAVHALVLIVGGFWLLGDRPALDPRRLWRGWRSALWMIPVAAVLWFPIRGVVQKVRDGA